MINRPQKIYQCTVFAWLVGLIAHCIWSVLQQRNRPPTDEVYTQFLSFQVASFTAATFPYWLGALLVILLIEFAMFGRKKQ